MTFNGWFQIALFSAVIVLLARPLGGYMTRVFAGERTFLSPVLHPLERVFYRLSGVNERTDQHWVTYAVAMLLFNLAGFLLLYAMQRFQAVLPFNPAGQSAVEAEARLQHGDELHHQHQLAVVRPRNDHELSRADGGAHGA